MPAYRAKPPKGATLNRSDPLANGLVRAYAMNERGGLVIYDLAGGNRGDGTLLNSPTWTYGPHGPALSFTGTARVSVGPPPAGSSFTVSALVYQTANTTYKSIYGDSTSSMNAKAGVLQWFQGTDRQSTFTLTLNRWHHVAMTYDGATLRFYADGAAAGTVSVGGMLLPTSTTVTSLGANGSSNPWAGSISSVLVHTRQLSARNIRDLAADPFRMFRRRSVPVPLWVEGGGGGGGFKAYWALRRNQIIGGGTR